MLSSIPSYKSLYRLKKYIQENVLLFEFLVDPLVPGLDVTDGVDEIVQSGILVFFLLFFEVFELFGGHVVRVVFFLELNEKIVTVCCPVRLAMSSLAFFWKNESYVRLILFLSPCNLSNWALRWASYLELRLKSLGLAS